MTPRCRVRDAAVTSIVDAGISVGAAGQCLEDQVVSPGIDWAWDLP